MATYTPKTNFLPHQLEHFQKHSQKTAWMIIWEQGCGKTKAAIDSFALVYQQGKIDAVLVIAPNGVHRNWIHDEIPKHLPDSVARVTRMMHYQTGKAGTKKHQREFDELLSHRGLSILAMSYDGFMTEAGKKAAGRFFRARKIYEIVDESHHIKTPNIKRTKSVIASGSHALYRRAVTGTPIAQKPFDIYAQVRFVDPRFWKRHGMDSFQAFKTHFGVWRLRQQVLEEDGYDPGYDQLLGYKNLDYLKDLIGEVGDRVTKESANLGIPPKLYSKRYFELTPVQRQVYRELADDFCTTLPSGVIVEAELPIVNLLRLQQTVCGYIGTGPGEPIEMLGEKNPRLDSLMEMLEELPHPAIVWSRFTKDIDLICDALGERAVRYDGEVTADQAEVAKNRFQGGECQFFVGNTARGSEGLTLTAAKTVVYYSNSFKLLHRTQSEDRAHRIGQHNAVHYVDMVAPGTVDEYILEALKNNKDIADYLHGDTLRRWLREQAAAA